MIHLRDVIWLLAISSMTAGIAMMHVPSALIFLGITFGAIAYYSGPRIS